MNPLRKSSQQPPVPPAPTTLKLWLPDEPEPQQQSSGANLSPYMRLSEFFNQWFLPVVLIAEENVCESTVKLYRDSLSYWTRIAGDPPIFRIDELLIAKFCSELRLATYKRGPLSTPKLLSSSSVKRHLRTLRTIIYRVGPQTDPERQTKNLLDKTPYIKIGQARFVQKSGFMIKEAQLIAAATEDMQIPKHAQMTPGNWWSAFIATLFYTGLRCGTIAQLRWSMITQRDGGWWLEVPADIVKTKKPACVALHAQLVEKLSHVMVLGEERDCLILPWPHCKRYLKTMHRNLQVLAGIAKGKALGLHAWRRTHGQEMGRLGYQFGMNIARMSLDHSSVKTTEAHYVQLENELRLKLPLLWPAAKVDPR